MKYLSIKDKRRRTLYNLYENKRLFMRTMVENFQLKYDFRMFIFKELRKIPNEASITRIRNRCILTNRPRGVYKKYGLSRLMFRKYAWKGKLIGVKKISW